MYICQGCKNYQIGRGTDHCTALQDMDAKIAEGKCLERRSLPEYDQFTEHPKEIKE